MPATMEILRKRAAMLRELRIFFEARGFFEVETPLASAEIIPELHIEPLTLPNGEFLQASPELHMKRLMSAGAQAIFQVTRSFRAGELGQLHHPEFTLVEWYRAGDDMWRAIRLLDELAQTLLGTGPATCTTYAEAFERVLGICPHTASSDELCAVAQKAGLAVPAGFDHADRDQWLNLLLALHIEPELGKDRPEILYHYPATQSSLARVTCANDGFAVAERFEMYFRGIELANGFHELTDAAEQRHRLDATNAARRAEGRTVLPIPESLLAALEAGLPDCSGVALGFDRVVMLAVGAKEIANVMAFPRV